MGKESLVYQAEAVLKRLEENNFKLLFTTDGFRCLGIVTRDQKRKDESLGVRRRWVQGLRFEDGTPLPMEERIFETSLHRKNPMSGQLDDIVVHEDGLMILSERKGFDLSDDDENFQFMANMHWMNKTQQLLDEIESSYRRISRLNEEKEESMLDVEHFKRESLIAKEKSKTQVEMLNRLTRENASLQERIGNLEAAYFQARARNLKYESFIDEKTANATEEGSVLGMTTDDQVLHAVEKKRDMYQAMHEIEPESLSVSEQMEAFMDELDNMKQMIQTMQPEKAPEKTKQAAPAA